jgi:hypothetical protein
MSVMVSKLLVLLNDPVSVLSSLLSSGISVLSSSGISVLSSSGISVLPIDPVLALSSSGGSREKAAISSLGASLGVDPVSLASCCSESSWN